MTKININHTPVLLESVLKYLDPKPGESYLDLTAGYGGHAGAIRARTNGWPVVLVDRDSQAVEYLKSRFIDEAAEVIHADFLTASSSLAASGRRFDMILADLGLSSPHLDNSDRGFAISKDGPLDMRMDREQALTAAAIVNKYSEEDLYKILRDFGEEPKAKKIAHAIVANRPIKTTQSLAEIIKKQFRGHHKVHPATKSFQAIRIAVNDELNLLTRSLPYWVHLLKPGGRLGVISFHSLEDRIVKNFLIEHAGNRYDAELSILTKRPVIADKHEVVSNPRSRSAKLRVAAKIKI